MIPLGCAQKILIFIHFNIYFVLKFYKYSFFIHQHDFFYFCINSLVIQLFCMFMQHAIFRFIANIYVYINNLVLI